MTLGEAPDTVIDAQAPLFILSFNHRDELALAAARAGWRSIAARRRGGIEYRFASSGAMIAVVDARGAFDEGLEAVANLSTAVEISAAALAYFKAIRAAAPQTLIFVLGPFTDWSNPSYSVTSFACRDAIFSAANQVSYTYTIDVSNWVTLANRDQVFNRTVYGPHPIDSGHYIYGQRAGDAIRAILDRI